MAFDQRLVTLEDVNYGASTQQINLERGVPTSELRCRLTASVTVTGANADAVILDDAMQRLISSIKVQWDSDALVDSIPLRDLYQVYARTVPQIPTQTEPTQAQLRAAATYAYELNFSIPFAWGFLRNKWDTHLPALPVRRQLKMFVEWNQDRVNAGTDDKGTGAFISAGTDAYTWSVEPVLEVTQVTHPLAAAGARPFYLPVITQMVTDTWTAATSRLVHELPDNRDFIMHIMRNTYGTNDALEDAINTVGFRATGEEWYDDISLDILRAIEAEQFPAVNNSTGYLGLMFASGGSIMKRIQPKTHNGLKYELNVATPTSGNGLVTITSLQLLAAKPYTVAQI